jgi:hypothetical protein
MIWPTPVSGETSDKAVERKITSRDNPTPGGLVCIGKLGRSRAERDTEKQSINERRGGVTMLSFPILRRYCKRDGENCRTDSTLDP